MVLLHLTPIESFSEFVGRVYDQTGHVGNHRGGALLISQNNKPGAVLVKLTPGEIERAIDIVQRGLTFFRRGPSPPSRTADPRRRRSSRPPHGLKVGLAPI